MIRAQKLIRTHHTAVHHRLTGVLLLFSTTEKKQDSSDRWFSKGIVSIYQLIGGLLLLKLEHVSKLYTGGKAAVRDFSLDIDQGEFICIIGPSGCGKTTTLKMINRLIEPTKGTVYLNGEDILKKNPIQLRRQIGYVIQQIGLFPHMTIGENIALVPKLLKWPSAKRRKRAEELIDMAHLGTDYLDRYPSELSGGQQQRIGVLRALAADPPLILMDEPFGALDPITRDDLQDEFKKLQQKMGKTIVFVTHDMDEAIKLADRIVIMREGEIVQTGTPDDILRNPENDFVKKFIGEDRMIQTRPSLERVEQIMDEHPVTIRQNRTLSEAVTLMRHRRVDTLLVVDEKKRFIGYVDIENIDRSRGESKYVGEVLQTNIFTVRQDTLLRDTVRRILKQGAKYVPVIDEQDHLTGIVTRASLVDIVYDNIWGADDGVAAEDK